MSCIKHDKCHDYTCFLSNGKVQQRKDPPDLIISEKSTSITLYPLSRSCSFTLLLIGILNTCLHPIEKTFVASANCSSSVTSISSYLLARYVTVSLCNASG